MPVPVFATAAVPEALPLQATRHRDTHALQLILQSHGTMGGLDGDVLYLKNASSISQSGFYFLSADGQWYTQLNATGTSQYIPVQATLGRAATCSVLDPRDPEESKTIAAHVKRLHDNTSGSASRRNTNPSLEVGLRACIRHAEEAVARPGHDACGFGEDRLARQCEHSRTTNTVAAEDLVGRTLALKHLQSAYFHMTATS